MTTSKRATRAVLEAMRGVTRVSDRPLDLLPPDRDGRSNQQSNLRQRFLRSGMQSQLPHVLTYTIPVLLVCAATFTWYDSGTFVAAGDVGPFYRQNLASNIFHSWGYSLTGAGSRIPDATRWIELALSKIARSLGGSPQAAQQLFLAFWIAVAVVAIVFCIRQLLQDARFSAAVPALLAVGNPLVLTTFANPLLLATLAGMSLACGATVRVARGLKTPIPIVALATLPFAFIAQNPAYFVTATFGLGLGILYSAVNIGTAGLRRWMRFAACITPILLLIHCWWIIPMILTYTSSTLPLKAETDVAGWAWSHANASIPRLLTFSAHWAWADYFPWTRYFNALPVRAATWLLPLTVLAGPLLVEDKRRRRFALSSLILAIVALWLAKGLHAPFAGSNLWLYRHIPGFWLFRDPLSKFGMVMLLVFIIGFAVVMQEGAERLRSTPFNTRRLAGAITAAAFLLPTFPLFTGQVIPGRSKGLPPARVRVPTGWEVLANRLNADPRQGKVLMLPTIPFYQMTTSWGFHGVADLPRQLIARPTLMELPGVYFTSPGTQAALVLELERKIRTNEPTGIARLLDALGVSHVIVREDFGRQVSGAPPPSVAGFTDQLMSTDLFTPPDRYPGVGILLTRKWIPPPLEVFNASANISSPNVDGIARHVSALPYGTAAIAKVQTSGKGAQNLHLGTGSRQVSVDFTRGVPYVGRIESSGHTKTLALSPDFALEVGGNEELSPKQLRVNVAGPQEFVGLEVDSKLVPARLPMHILLQATSRLAPLFSAGSKKTLSNWSRVEDCEDPTMRTSGMSIKSTTTELTLRANQRAACVWTRVSASDSNIYRIHFEQRTLRGDASRACFAIPGRDRCATSILQHPAGDWEKEVMLVRTRGDGGRLYLRADAWSGEPTVKQYRGIFIEPVDSGERWNLKPDSVQSRVYLAPGSVVREKPQTAPFLNSISDLGNCNIAAGSAGHRMNRLGETGVRLSARQGSACVTVGLPDVFPGHSYRLSFEHRTVHGAPARICVFVERVNACATPNTTLPLKQSFAASSIDFEVPKAATGATVFLYADGLGARDTVVEYKNLRLQPVTSYAIVATERESSSGTRNVKVTLAERETLRFDIEPSARSIVLALSEAADPGWRLRDVPQGSISTPIVVDGYRQGWRIDNPKAFTGTIEFAPATWASRGRALSLATLLVLLAILFAPRVAIETTKKYMGSFASRIKGRSG